jgi:hypothetical protein
LLYSARAIRKTVGAFYDELIRLLAQMYPLLSFNTRAGGLHELIVSLYKGLYTKIWVRRQSICAPDSFIRSPACSVNKGFWEGGWRHIYINHILFPLSRRQKHTAGLLLNGNGDVCVREREEECVIVGAPDMTPTATEGLNWIDFLSAAGALFGADKAPAWVIQLLNVRPAGFRVIIKRKTNTRGISI